MPDESAETIYDVDSLSSDEDDSEISVVSGSLES